MFDSLVYPREKFTTALYSLTSGGSLKSRILNAYMSFHPIKASDFKDEDLRSKYEELYRRLTAVKDGPSDNGYVQNSVDRMTDDEARQVSDLITDLALQIRDRSPR